MGSSNTGGGAAAPKEEPAGDDPSAAASPSPESPGAALFSEGEKVLAYHCHLIYEAKVQKTEFRKDEWKYFVHYLGWNKNWDEWVDADRLLKFTDENLHKQTDLKNQSSDKIPKSGRPAQFKPKSSNDEKVDKEDLKNSGVRGKKRKGVEEKDTKSQEKQMILQFPLTLKKQLVDDWEFVTQLGKLVKLPRSPNVDDILKKYLDYRVKKDGKVADSVTEILKGLRNYFDKALPAMLLYKKERQQYHEAMCDHISPSAVYGAEHLLRLFGSCRKTRILSSSLLMMVSRTEMKQMKKRSNLAACPTFVQHGSCIPEWTVRFTNYCHEFILCITSFRKFNTV